MEVLTKQQVEHLELNDELISISNGNYLEDTSNKNFKEIKRHIFSDLDTDKVKLLNTGCAGGETIVGTYTGYVGKPKTEHKFNIKSVVSDYTSINKICLGIEVVDGKPVIIHISAKDHIRENEKDYVYTFYRKIKSASGFSKNLIAQVDHYVLKQEYSLGNCINELFLLDVTNKREGIKKPLDTIPETSHLVDELKTDYSKIFFCYSDEGNSILKKSKKIIYAMDRKICSFEKEFLQYTEQIRIFNNISVSQEATKARKIDWSTMGRNFINKGGDKASLDIVNNVNQLLETSIEYNDNEYERLSSVSYVPKNFFGKDESTGNNSGTAIIKRSGSFFKKIQEIRGFIEELYLEIMEVISGDDIIDWESIVSYGEDEKLESAEKALNLGIMSKRKAMQRVYNYSDEEIEEELELINNESKNEDMNKGAE